MIPGYFKRELELENNKLSFPPGRINGHKHNQLSFIAEIIRLGLLLYKEAYFNPTN